MSDYDKCAYYHRGIQMSCGGFRKNHAERYPGHSFVEPSERPVQESASVIENIVNGVSVICESGKPGQSHGTITVRDPRGKTQAIINAIVDSDSVTFQQVCFVSNSAVPTTEPGAKGA